MNALAPFLSPRMLEVTGKLLDESAKAKLAMMASEVQNIAESLAPAETSLQAHALSECLSRASVAAKELDQARRKRVDPLNDEVKQVNAVFKAITSQLDALEDKGKSYLLAWNQRERARVQREKDESDRLQRVAAENEAKALGRLQEATTEEGRLLALAEAEKASGEQAKALAVAPRDAPRAYRDDVGTNSTRTVWAFELVALADVPREWLILDEARVRKAIAGKNGLRSIGGLHIYPEEGIVTRTATR